MPLIKAKFSVPVTKEKEIIIKKGLGEAICKIPGKSEASLMVDIKDNQHLYFGGSNDEPIALFEIKLLGTCSKDACKEVTEKLCEIATNELNIKGKNIYVTFEELEKWGNNSRMY